MNDMVWPVPALPDDIVARRIAYDPKHPLLQPWSACILGFQAGTDMPRAYLERLLEAAAEHEPSVRAFVIRDDAASRAAADASTARWQAGKPLSPVDGMPVAVKDMIETIDFPTSMNSPIYQGFHARRDAAAVWALRKSGAIILGKTVTTEFACSNSGPTRNPYDSARTPGGSSSGSAASVGAGMAAFALGTQTQASTLRPAAFCGAWGFKSSFGALHVGGLTPLAPTQDHLGLIAASLADLWAGAMAIANTVGGTPPFHALHGPDNLPEPRKPVVLARLEMQGWAETPETSRAEFEATLQRLEAAGVSIVSRHNDPEIEALERELSDANAWSLDILAWETRWPLQAYAAHGPGMIGQRIHDLLNQDACIDRATYDRALIRRENLRACVAALAARIDGFPGLCSSGPAAIDHGYTGSRSWVAPWTMVGGPAFALPVMAVDDLPLGLQLCGFTGADADLCAIAAWLDKELLG